MALQRAKSNSDVHSTVYDAVIVATDMAKVHKGLLHQFCRSTHFYSFIAAPVLLLRLNMFYVAFYRVSVYCITVEGSFLSFCNNKLHFE